MEHKDTQAAALLAPKTPREMCHALQEIRHVETLHMRRICFRLYDKGAAERRDASLDVPSNVSNLCFIS